MRLAAALYTGAFATLLALAPASLAVDIGLRASGAAPAPPLPFPSLARIGVLSAHTAWVAAGATAVAVVLGLFAAAALMRLGRGRGASFVRAAYPATLLVPPTVTVAAWLAATRGVPALDRGGVATALVLGWIHWPIICLLATRAASGLGGDALAAARLAGDAVALRRVVWPSMRPAVVAGARLVSALALIDAAVPAILDYPVLALEVQAEFAASGDPTRAAGIGALVALPTALILAHGVRGGPLPSPAVGPAAFVSAWRWPAGWTAAALAGGAVIAASMAVPIVTLGASALRLNPARVPAATGAELVRSAALAGTTAILGTALAWGVAGALLRGGRAARGCAWLAALSMATPASLTGIGVARAFTWFPLDLRDGHLPLLAAQLARLLPLALVLAVDRRRALDPAPLDAAALFAMSGVTRQRVVWPLVRTAVVPVAALGFLLAMGDLSLGVMLAPPGSGTIGMRILNWIHAGAAEELAWMCLGQLTLAAAVLGGAGAVSGEPCWS